MIIRLTACLSLLLLAAPILALTPCTTLVVPAAARGAGAGTSVWQMDLYLVNTGNRDAKVELYWLERNTDNSSVVPVTLTVLAGQTVVLEDVIRERFGRESGGGAIRIESDFPIAATSRIYNLQGGVTFGQGFDGLSTAAATTACMKTVVSGLRQDAGSRSNLFAVAGQAGTTFTVEARSSAGLTLGSASFTAPRWGAVYIPLANLAGANSGPLMTVISVNSGSAWFAGSRIDEGSGDPFTLAAIVPDESLTLLMDLSGTYFGYWGLETGDEVDGDAMMVVAVDENTGTASITLDFIGPLLDGVDPAPVTVAGPIGPGSGSFHGVSAEFGMVTSTIDAHGHATWTATGLADPDLQKVEATGIITADQVLMSWAITWSGQQGVSWGGMALVRQE